MQVILKKDIPQLGRIGELVNVREGYARNFLIPRALAMPANPANVKVLEHHKRVVDAHKKKVQKDSAALASKWNGTKVELSRKFNEAGKMYGTISASDLVVELKKLDILVDRRDLEFDAIKAAGEYVLKVRLPGDVYSELKLVVLAEEEKAAKAEKKAKAKTAKPRKTKAKASATAEESSETPESE